MREDLRQYIGALRQCELFRGIGDDAVISLLEEAQARVSEYGKGELILSYGDHVSRMGIVLEGMVTIEVDEASGDKINMNMMGPGNEFGGFHVVSGHTHSWMSIYAGSRCRIMYLDVLSICNSQTHTADEWQLMNNLMVIFSNKCVELYQRVRLYGQKRVRLKLRTYLIELAGEDDEVVLPMNRTQLASFLGVERTAMAREMARMQQEGIIAVNKRRIQLLDRAFFHLDDRGHVRAGEKANGLREANSAR